MREHNQCLRVALVSPRGSIPHDELLSSQRTSAAESLADISAQLGRAWRR